MLYTTFAITVLLMHRLGLFDEYFDYRRMRELDKHVMTVADDAIWQDRMDRFRGGHPHLQKRCTMRFG